MKIERISMKKYIINYLKYVEANKKDIDVYKHLQKIEFFQAERLIHLLVTLATLIVEIISFVVGVALQNIYCIIIGYMIMCFLIPYILHYFFLENAMWKMYREYDEMINHKQ